MCEIERCGFDVCGEIIGLLEEAREAFGVPEDTILGGFVRGRFLPGVIEEVAHFADGFGGVGDAEDVFVGAIIIGPWACPALFLEGEEAAHGCGGWAEHVVAEGVVDGVDVGVGVPEDAEVEVGIEREASAIGRGADEGACGGGADGLVVRLDEVAEEVRGVGKFCGPTGVVPIDDGAAGGAGPVVDEGFFAGASGGIFEEREAWHGADGGFDVGERGEVEGWRDGAGVDVGEDEDEVVGMGEAGPGGEARGEVRPEEGRGGGGEAEVGFEGGAAGWAGAGDDGVPGRDGDSFVGGVDDAAGVALAGDVFVDALAVVGERGGARVAEERRGGAGAVGGEGEDLREARDEVGVAIPARGLVDADGAAVGGADFGEAGEGVGHVVGAEDAIVEGGLVGVVDAREDEVGRGGEARDEGGVGGGVVGVDALTEEAFAEVVDGVIGAAEEVEGGVVGRGSEDAEGFRMRCGRVGRGERRGGAEVEARGIVGYG